MKQAKLSMALSMAIFGTISIFTKQIPMTSAQIALWRPIIGLLVLLPVLLFGRKLSLAAVKKQLVLLLLSGAAMGFNWVLLFEAYEYTTVSMATLCYYTAPVLVSAICPLLFRERPTALQWVCMAMALAGMVLVVGTGNLAGGANPALGMLLAFGAAVLYASVIIANKYIVGVDGMQRTLWQFLAAVLVLTPYVLVQGGSGEPMTVTGIVCLLVLGLVHTGLSYCMYFSAVKSLSGLSTAILSAVDPLVAIVVSALFFREALTAYQIIGGGLILGFTLLSEARIQ